MRAAKRTSTTPAAIVAGFNPRRELTALEAEARRRIDRGLLDQPATVCLEDGLAPARGLGRGAILGLLAWLLIALALAGVAQAAEPTANLLGCYGMQAAAQPMSDADQLALLLGGGTGVPAPDSGRPSGFVEGPTTGAQMPPAPPMSDADQLAFLQSGASSLQEMQAMGIPIPSQSRAQPAPCKPVDASDAARRARGLK